MGAACDLTGLARGDGRRLPDFLTGDHAPCEKGWRRGGGIRTPTCQWILPGSPSGLCPQKKNLRAHTLNGGWRPERLSMSRLQRGKGVHNTINQRLEEKNTHADNFLFARAAEPLAPPENGNPEPFAVPPEVAF